MPTYTLTSPRTGKDYDIDFFDDPDDDTVDEIMDGLDREYAAANGVTLNELDQGSVESGSKSAVKSLLQFPMQALGGIAEGIDTAADWVADVTGTKKGGLFGAVADHTKESVAAANDLLPVDPANKIANTIGSAVGQVIPMIGSAGMGAAFGGVSAAAKVPLLMGGSAALGQGIDTAEEIGIEHPLGKLALGAGFAVPEMLVEKLGGIGNTAAMQAVRGGIKQAAKNVLSEFVEEPLTGFAQEGATLAAAHLAGTADSHAEALPKAEGFLERRGLEAIGGAAGGTVFAAVQQANPSPQQGNVTEGSPTAAPGSYPVAEVSGDAGSTPAVAANNLTLHQANLLAGLVRNVPGVDPAQVGQVTLRIAPQIQWNEDATLDDLQSQVTQALSEPTIPVATAVAEDSSATAAAVGPTSLMDVANRAGRVDSYARLQTAEQTLQTATDPAERAAAAQAANTAEVEIAQAAKAPQTGGRVQFAKKKPLANSYDEVRNGHPVRSIKQHILRAPDPMPRIAEEDLNESAATLAVGQMIEQTPVITDAQGKRVLLANPDTPSRGAKPSYAKEDRYKQGPRIFNRDKASTALAVPATVADYHIKAHDPKTRQTLYLRRYADGNLHAVITDRESRVTDFGEVQGGLTTQRSPKPIEAFDGFFVEDKRTPGATVPPLDTRRGTQTQKAASSLTPQTQTTPRNQQSKPFVPGVSLNTLVKNTRAVAQQAARLLNQQLPGIVGPKLTFVANPAELLASNYAAENSFTAEEVAQMQDAEGFFDNDTGHTIIFTDSIEVRPGESERAAVARVILHERIGHDGVNAMMLQPEFARAWATLSAKIPEAELNNIIAEGYSHLAADRNQLALEWLARQVESRVHLKEGLAQRMWQAVKNWINNVRSPFAESTTWTHEADLMAIINKARDAAQNGTAIPTTADGMRGHLNGTTDSPAVARSAVAAVNATIDAFNHILASGAGAGAQVTLPNLGPVTVEWGNPGNPTKQFKQGYGLSHIIARRALVEGKDAAKWLQQLARTLHHGVQGAPYGHPGNPRVEISLGGQRAVISLERHGQSENWLLTAFDDASAAGATSGNAHPSSATHIRPSFTHADVVAAAQLQLPHIVASSTPRLQFSVGLHTLKTGSVLPTSLHEVMQSTQAQRSALDNAFARVSSMIDTGVTQAVKRTGQPLSTVYDRVNAALDGNPNAMAVLQATDPALAEATRRGRNMLDDMSQLIANTLPSSSPARANIVGNMGHWMRRSYAAFDASAGWNYETLMEAAQAGKQLNGQDARQIVKAAAAYLVSQDPALQGQRQSNGLPRDNTELAFTIQDLVNRDTWTTSLVPGGKSPRKNVTSLTQRKEISPEIRQLMGEHTNPLTRFNTSASFQTQFVAKHQGLQAMRDIILTTGLGSTSRTTEFSKQLAQNEGWNPLNDLWISPTLQKDLQSVATIDQAGAMNFGHNAWTFLKALTANAKVNLVALNPISLMTNIYGGAVASMQTGDVFTTRFLTNFQQAWAAGRSGKVSASQLQALTMQGIQDAEQTLRTELIANGVLDSNLTLQDLQAGNAEAIISLFGDDPKFQARANKALGALHGAAIGNAFGRLGGGVGQLAGTAIGGVTGAVIGGKRIMDFNKLVASYTLGRPDAVFKILGYLSNLRTAKLAGIANPEAWAAERTRNTYPTYDKIPAALRQVSLLPVPALGSFLSFMYEVGRNSIWNARYAKQDLLSGNLALQKMGAKRLMGQSLVWGGLAYGVSAGLGAAIFGWDAPDEEKKKAFMKWIASDYERDGTLTFKSMDSQGITYFNHAYIVPQASYLDFLRLAASDVQEEGFNDAIYNSMGRAARMFGAGNNLANTFYEAVSNTDKFGNKITAKEGVEGFMRQVDHVAKTYGDPGYAKFAVALAKAADAGDHAELERQMNRFLGIRDRRLPWEKAAKTAGYRFQNQRQAVRDALDEELRNPHLGSNPQANVARANAELANIARDIEQFRADMAKHFPQIRDHLAEANIPRTIHQLDLTTVTDAYGKRTTKAVTTSRPVK